MTLMFFLTSRAGTEGCSKVFSFHMGTITVALQIFGFNVSLF